MGTQPARLGYVPHFDVTTLGGRHVRYDDIWQRRNLVLIVVGAQPHEAVRSYVSQLESRQREFDEEETAVVVTTDEVQGLEAPRALVADRWGEILYTESPPAGDATQLPDVDELLAWVHFARIQCPECPP